MKMYYLCVKNLLKLAIVTFVNAFERMVFGFRSPDRRRKGTWKKRRAMIPPGRDGGGRQHPEGSWHGNGREKNRGQTDWEASRSATM